MFASPPRKIRRVIRPSLLGSFFPRSLVRVVAHCGQVRPGDVLCQEDSRGHLHIEEPKVNRSSSFQPIPPTERF